MSRRLAPALALLLASPWACGYALEGASGPRLTVRLEVPAVASTEPSATPALREALERELASRGIAVDPGSRRRLRVEIEELRTDLDLAAALDGEALAGRVRARAVGLARLAGAGQAWTVRVTGEVDGPAAAAGRSRAARRELLVGALSALARDVADRLEDGFPDGR